MCGQREPACNQRSRETSGDRILARGEFLPRTGDGTLTEILSL